MLSRGLELVFWASSASAVARNMLESGRPVIVVGAEKMLAVQAEKLKSFEDEQANRQTSGHL